MRIIRQKYQNDCAIAAASMITGITYHKVFKAIHPQATPKRCIGTPLNKLLNGMIKLGFIYKVISKKIRLEQLKTNTYISVNTFDNDRHAVVWDAKKKRVIDPKRGRTYIDRKYTQKNMNFIVLITKEK